MWKESLTSLLQSYFPRIFRLFFDHDPEYELEYNNPDFPVPAELLEPIIYHTWYLPLSTSERATVMKNFLLVNKAWSKLFLRISCRDVHIPSREYADHLAGIMTGLSESQTYRILSDPATGNLCLSPQNLTPRQCRSITIHCIDTMWSFPLKSLSYAQDLNPASHPMYNSIRLTHLLFENHYLPYLRQISIHFDEPADISAALNTLIPPPRGEVWDSTLSPSWYRLQVQNPNQPPKPKFAEIRSLLKCDELDEAFEKWWDSPGFHVLECKRLGRDWREARREYGPKMLSFYPVMKVDQSAKIQEFLADCIMRGISHSNEHRRYWRNRG